MQLGARQNSISCKEWNIVVSYVRSDEIPRCCEIEKPASIRNRTMWHLAGSGPNLHPLGLRGRLDSRSHKWVQCGG